MRIRKTVFGEIIKEDCNSYIDAKKAGPFDLFRLITLKKAHEILTKNNGVYYGIYSYSTSGFEILEDAYLSEKEVTFVYSQHIETTSKKRFIALGYKEPWDLGETMRYSQEFNPEKKKIFARKIDENALYVLIEYLSMSHETNYFSVLASSLFAKKVDNISIIKMLECEIPKRKYFIKYLKKTDKVYSDERFVYYRELTGTTFRDAMFTISLLEKLGGEEMVEDFLANYKKGGVSKSKKKD